MTADEVNSIELTGVDTARLRLRPLQERYREAFAIMQTDPEVMADLGGPFDRAASDEKFDRYRAWHQEHGHSRWAIEDSEGQFIGYAGVCPRTDEDHPLGSHREIGWRLVRAAWGNGYATEAASAALRDAMERCRMTEVFSYTSSDNVRSHAVMRKMGLERDPALDFTHCYTDVPWSGLVWVARQKLLKSERQLTRAREG